MVASKNDPIKSFTKKDEITLPDETTATCDSVCKLFRRHSPIWLNLANRNLVQPESQKCLATHVATAARLRCLTLDGNPLNRQGLTDLVQAILNNAACCLDTLSLCNAELQPRDGTTLGRLLAGTKSLQVLEASHNSLKAEGLTYIIEALMSNSLCPLVMLNLSFNKVSHIDIDALENALTLHERLQINLLGNPIKAPAQPSPALPSEPPALGAVSPALQDLRSGPLLRPTSCRPNPSPALRQSPISPRPGAVAVGQAGSAFRSLTPPSRASAHSGDCTDVPDAACLSRRSSTSYSVQLAPSEVATSAPGEEPPPKPHSPDQEQLQISELTAPPNAGIQPGPPASQPPPLRPPVAMFPQPRTFASRGVEPPPERLSGALVNAGRQPNDPPFRPTLPLGPRTEADTRRSRSAPSRPSQALSPPKSALRCPEPRSDPIPPITPVTPRRAFVVDPEEGTSPCSSRCDPERDALRRDLSNTSQTLRLVMAERDTLRELLKGKGSLDSLDAKLQLIRCLDSATGEALAQEMALRLEQVLEAVKRAGLPAPQRTTSRPQLVTPALSPRRFSGISPPRFDNHLTKGSGPSQSPTSSSRRNDGPLLPYNTGRPLQGDPCGVAHTSPRKIFYDGPCPDMPPLPTPPRTRANSMVTASSRRTRFEAAPTTPTRRPRPEPIWAAPPSSSPSVTPVRRPPPVVASVYSPPPPVTTSRAQPFPSYKPTKAQPRRARSMPSTGAASGLTSNARRVLFVAPRAETRNPSSPAPTNLRAPRTSPLRSLWGS